MLVELTIILLLVLVNGVFAMAEMAVVSARRARLEQAARAGDKGAAAALALAEHPNRFLSTVQIGITLIGVLAGAFGGATVSEKLAAKLALYPALAPHAEALAIGIVVVGITYLSLILGELVPKRLALMMPEVLARRLAQPMRIVSTIAAPAVWLLTASTDLVLRLLPGKQGEDPSVTDEEVRHLMRQGAASGHFHPAERTIVEKALRLGDREVAALMTPRSQIEALNLQDSREAWHRTVLKHRHGRYPVVDGGIDHVVGVLWIRDLAAALIERRPFDLRALMLAPLFIPELAPALQLLETFRSTHDKMAFLVDEYGAFQGIVTLNDILTALLGETGAAEHGGDPSVVRRADGSWLIDGMLPIDALADTIGAEKLLEEEDGPHRTVAGLVMAKLRRIPTCGDTFELQGYQFEVVDMDGRRIDKVLVGRIAGAPAES